MFGNFITGLGYSMTMPFVSLFMSELHNYSKVELNLYAGLAFAATFIAQSLMAPVWGSLADRKGRKLMCLRASGVMSFTIFITGLATGAWYIIIMRFIQGLFSGYINNATALIAGETPHKRSGWVISQMLTASTAGTLLGPLIGGVLTSAIGHILPGAWQYRCSFFITGFLMFLVFISTLTFVHEEFTPIEKDKMQPMMSLLKSLPDLKLVILMFFTTMIVQSSTLSVDPIVSLYVKSLIPHSPYIVIIAGIVAAAPGLGTLIASRQMGHKLDEIGPLKALKIGLLVATILFIPMGFTNSPLVLAGLRFLLGIAAVALIPAAQTVLTLSTPKEAFGRIFSYNQAFQALGSVMGSLMGSTVSGFLSFRDVFWITGSTLLVVFIILLFNTSKQTKSAI
ncbi:MAG: MFS transporter [Lactobacillus sp.]|nr:MFS transporter [Lactobacillus sp.]